MQMQDRSTPNALMAQYANLGARAKLNNPLKQSIVKPDSEKAEKKAGKKDKEKGEKTIPNVPKKKRDAAHLIAHQFKKGDPRIYKRGK